jgi:hypothetical protein
MARDDEETRLLGRMLVLLGDGNELRARRAPAWRVRRNRLRLDRALAELARLRSRELVTHP